MNAVTLEALEGSIRKWEGIVAGTVKQLGHANCPLCKLFLSPKEPRTLPCTGCPVKKVSGRVSCLDTPFEDYEYLEDKYGENSPEAIKAARVELEFLKSLHPQASLRLDPRT